jgi:hypothetical protein
MYLASHSSTMGILEIIYYTLFGGKNVLYDATIIVILLLHFLFHYVELQFNLVVSTNLKSPSDSCLSPFNHSSLEKKIATNLSPYNIVLFINES